MHERNSNTMKNRRTEKYILTIRTQMHVYTVIQRETETYTSTATTKTTTTTPKLSVHENSSISTRIIIKLMLGKWVTNRWARFGCLAYCQYTFMLCFTLTIYWALLLLVVSTRSALFWFSHLFLAFVLCFRCISSFFVFIILLFNFMLLVIWRYSR